MTDDLFKFLRLIFIGTVFLFSCSQNRVEDKESSDIQTPKDELTILNDEIAATPGDAELYYKRSVIFLGRNINKQSFDDIQKAISIDSSLAKYHLQLGEIYFKTLQIQSAIDAFNKAASLDNTSPGNKLTIDTQLKLAELYLYVKAYNKSLESANFTLKLDKYQAKAYFIKGFCYKEMGDTLKALSSFQTAVEVNADYYDAYIQLGNIQSAKKNPIAIQYYNNALKIRPRSTEAFYNRGLFLQNMGETEKAIDDYKTILKIDNEYADAYYNLGYIDLAFKKDYKSAISHFTDAIRYNSEYAEAYYNRGIAFESTGDKASAKKDFQKAVEIYPKFKQAIEKLK